MTDRRLVARVDPIRPEARAANVMGIFDRFLGKPTPRRFAEKLIARVSKADPSAELRYDPDGHRIVRLVDGVPSGVIHLDNLYRTYCETPPRLRGDYLGVCVRSALVQHRELPEEFDAAAADVRPRLWSRVSFEQIRLKGRTGEPGGSIDLPCESIGEHLLATVVYDWPEAVQTINSADLDRWGITVYEAMEVARRNLAEAEFGYARIGENLYAFTSGDSYDASRLLLIDRIADLELDGRPVALVPNRNSLLIAGEDDPTGLELLAGLGAQQLEEAYALSGVPVVLDGDAWIDWRPPADHPLARRFREMELRWIGPLYTAQKDLLNAAHEAEGSGPFVAGFSAIEKQDGELVSYCVWAEGVDTLLPVAQKVVFVREVGGGPVALADWDRVRAVVGDLMEPTDEYPTRHRVRAFPDAAALAAIGLGAM